MTICYKSPGALVRAVRIAKENPDRRFEVQHDFPLYSADILANFQKGLMLRCNRGLSIVDDHRFQDLKHDARVINDAARGIRWPGNNLLRSKKLIRRFPHINTPPVE